MPPPPVKVHVTFGWRHPLHRLLSEAEKGREKSELVQFYSEEGFLAEQRKQKRNPKAAPGAKESLSSMMPKTPLSDPGAKRSCKPTQEEGASRLARFVQNLGVK